MASNDGSFDQETTSSEILCSEILCRIPFKKTAINGETVQIDSKNQVEEEDALQLEQWIQHQEVILSHSSNLQLQEHCRGIVEEVEYEKKNLKVTVSSETGCLIWADSDVWMHSLATPASSVCATEPNTSADTEPSPMPDDSPKPKFHEMEQTELFESINGWKLIDKKRLRMRKKEDGTWKNMYLLEIQMTCVDPEKQELLEHIQDRTTLRLSDDIDEPGVVLVDVIRKCVEEGKLKTITVGVTGFLTRDVNIPLNSATTFYLNVYDIRDDDVGSMASEDGVLSGYPLVQSLDELCEKIGELTITDVCARLWCNDHTNYCFIRLLVTSLKNMSNFKKLTGHHVIITSKTNDLHVLAVVNRVFNEEMVLTLKGVPQYSKDFFFSNKEGLTIQMAHAYDDRLLDEKGKIEKLRFDLANSSTEIRFQRYWQETINNEHTRNYASFTVKNEAFLEIPMNTRVILGKCYDIQAPVEKKADFAIARRVNHVIGNTELTLVFELINTKQLVEDAENFKISKAFYYVDFDSTDDIKNDSTLSESRVESQIYCLMNARNSKDPMNYSLARKNPIGKELKFFVFPMDEKFQAKRRKKYQQWQQKTKTIGKPSRPTTPIKNNNPPVWNLPTKPEMKEGLKRFGSQGFGVISAHPEDPRPPKTEFSKPPGNEPWNNLQTLPDNTRRMCFVQISDAIAYDNRDPLIKLTTGFDENGGNVKMAPISLGRQVAVTAGVGEKKIRIRGQVHDTHGISANRHNQGGQGSFRYGFSLQAQEGV